MERFEIERVVRAVQFEVWKDRELLFPMGVPPVHHIFEPAVVAAKLGLGLERRASIPAMPGAAMRAEAAGTYDGRRGVICVSTRFDITVQRFTVAHEIAHHVLHPSLAKGVLHRDRPIHDLSEDRPPIEKEADYFAACLLVPLKLLEEQFRARFGSSKPLPLNEATAFLLRRNAHELFGAPRPRRAFACALACAQSFDRRRFTCLKDHFGVSISALAIRLEEAGLVVD